MAAIVLAQVGTSMLAPGIYTTIASGASVGAASSLWGLSQGIAGFIGSSVGGAIDRAVFGTGVQDAQGPRLSDLSVQSSTDGAPLPKVFGTYRMAGNVIWSTGLEEVSTRHGGGGGGGSGGGGGGGSVTTYSYRTDVAVALCEGEITGIRRIWADTKLIYDVGDSADAGTLLASNERAAAIRIYPGSESQDPDPLIQAIEGAASTPAYRGTAYIVFEDLQLADFGNRLPNFQFEVVREGTPSVGLVETFTAARPTDVHNPSYPPKWNYAFNGNDARLAVGWGQTYGSGKRIALNLYQVIPGGGIVFDRYASMDATPGYNVVVTYDGHLSATDEPGLVYREYDTVGGSGTPYYWFGMLNGALGQTYISNPASDPHPMDLNFSLDSFSGVAKRGNVFAVRSEDSGYFCISRGGVNTPYPHTMASEPNAWCISESYVHMAYIASSLSGCIFARFDLTTGAQETMNTAPTGDACCTSFSPCIRALDDDRLLIGNGKIYSYTDNTITNLDGVGGISGNLAEIADSIYAIADVPSSDIRIRHYGPALAIGNTFLDDVVSEIFESAGLSPADYDVTDLGADTVRGYLVGRPMAMRSALDPLMMAYAFDVVEIDGVLTCIKRGNSAALTLDEDDLGADTSPDGTRLAVNRTQPADLPSQISLTYLDQDADYQPATQYARRLTASHENISTASVPLVLTSQEGARLADSLLNIAWYTGRHSLTWSLDYSHARVTPTDVVEVPGYGQTWTARLTQVDLGAPGIVQCQAVPELPSLYTSLAVGADATGIGQSLSPSGPAKLALLDCVMLRDQDTDPGWYVAMGGYTTAWPGGTLYKSNDGGATWTAATIVTAGTAAVMGYATTTLADDGCTTWDRTNTVTVRLYPGGTLSSATEDAVLNGSNAALLGAHGRWELIQFQTATLNGDGTYTLSTLLRGRKGTDHAAGSHAAYDSFILLSTDTAQDLPITASEISAERHFKAVTSGKALEATLQEAHTYTGERLECLSPVDLRASRDGSGNITLTWKRRDRINAGWNNYADIPMSEATESYEVEIYTSSSYGTVQRTITGLASATASYTAAQQVTDFGSNQSTVYARVYQLSASVGRGHYRQGAV